MAGAKELDWSQVTEASGTRLTEWVFTAKGCSWRNGAAEVMIRSARRTLAHLLERREDLDFHEADAALRKVGEILNRWPLSIRSATEDNYYAITPGDLLLGRAAGLPQDTEDLGGLEQDEEVARMLPAQEQLAKEWWLEWTRSCFSDLVPRAKWKVKERNVKEGDIALLKYSSKFSAPAFRLCRITATKEDEEGLVRSCEVKMRPRRSGESGQATYKYRRPEPLTVGVQRLAVILPIEEQNESTGEPSGANGALPTEAELAGGLRQEDSEVKMKEGSEPSPDGEDTRSSSPSSSGTRPRTRRGARQDPGVAARERRNPERAARTKPKNY